MERRYLGNRLMERLGARTLHETHLFRKALQS
jgi:hypothetical protein